MLDFSTHPLDPQPFELKLFHSRLFLSLQIFVIKISLKFQEV